ncbi:MAG: RNA polymerase sigma factor [Acidimicrobiales bacterium]
MGEESPAATGDLPGFLAFYDGALPQVYSYLSARCESRAVAEDLTAETFLAAVEAARLSASSPMSTTWVVGVARHKLADHWRRQARDGRRFQRLAEAAPQVVEPWDAQLDVLAVRRCLGQLAAQHRAALTLRYVDDLTVPEVASLLGRSVQATEALLVRARAAFRRSYTGRETPDA